MPARHTSLQVIPLLGADFKPAALVDERGCRRDIRSNGWIVLPKGSLFRKTVRQKKRVFFVRCGSNDPQFHGALKAEVKSGPDVFADALVPPAGADDARRLRLPPIA